MSELNKRSTSRDRRLSGLPHAEHGGGGEEGWLISYADMMTLLFGFFVILFSMSNMDKKKYEAMSESMAQQFQAQAKAATQAPPPPASSQFSRMLKQQLIRSGLDTHDVEMIDDGKSLTISLRGKASFDSGKTTLLPAGEEFIGSVGRYLTDSNLPYEVRVEGHTDDAPISSPVFPTNWELSAARAAGVARILESLEIPADRLVAAGYGSSRPLAPNRHPDGTPILDNMAKNRRVMIIVSFPDQTPRKGK